MSTDPRTIAADLIREHAKDVEYLSIAEHLDELDIDNPELTKEIADLIRKATVLVGWPAATPSEPAAGLDLDAIEARANAATPGPWEPDGSDLYAGAQLAAEGEPETSEADARFAAAARADVPALAAEVRRLREQLATADQQIASMRAALDEADAEPFPA